MAGSSQLTIFLTFLILSLASTMAEEVPTKKDDKKIDVVVEGMVYCQSCNHFGTWSLTGAEPIPAAKVSVICKDHKNRVNFYKAFDTDAHGYFHAQLEGFKMKDYLLDHPLQACHVKLISSSLKKCNLLSNINYGLNGSPLRYENKRLSGKSYKAVIYAAGPLAFRPDHCPK